MIVGAINFYISKKVWHKLWVACIRKTTCNHTQKIERKNELQKIQKINFFFKYLFFCFALLCFVLSIYSCRAFYAVSYRFPIEKDLQCFFFATTITAAAFAKCVISFDVDILNVFVVYFSM